MFGLLAVGRHRPQPVARALVVGHVDRGRPARQVVQELGRAPADVAVQRHDRTRVDTGRAEELVAVLLRPRERPLVRQHRRAGLERLEPQPPEEPALGALGGRARHAVRLLVHVDGRVRVLAERAVGAPRGQRPGGAAVPLVGLVAGLLGRQVEPDDVGRVPGDELGAAFLVDDVVRRRDDVREVSDDGRVEAEGSKWSDLGHGVLVGDLRRGRWWKESIVR